jgi:hypothetical protein
MPDGFGGSLGLDFTARDLTGPAFASLNTKLDAVADRTEQMSAAMGKAPAAMEVFKGSLGALQVDKLIDQFGEFHSRVVEQTAGFKDLAERLQIGVVQYQALRLAGIEAGVSQMVLQQTIVRFNSVIGDAENGTRKSVEAFQQLGVKILDSAGHVRPMTDLLQEAARALLQMEDGSRKARLETELFGRAGADLNPMLAALAKGTDALTEKFQAAGLIIDRDTVESLKRLQVQSEASKARFEALYATVALPIYVGAIDALSAKMLEITNRISSAHGAWQKFLAAIDAAGPVKLRPLGQDPDDLGRLQRAEQLRQQIESFDKRIDNPRRGDAPTDRLQASRAKLQAELAGIESEMDAVARAQARGQTAAADRDRLLNDGLPAQDIFKTAGASNPAVKGGRGAGSRDRVGDAITRLQGEKAAADKALSAMMAGASMPLTELNRQIELQKKIDDEIARLGSTAKNDPRLAQLKQEVAEQQKAEDALKRYQAAAAEADAVTRKYGDGTLALDDTMRKLNDALDSGRLKNEVYAIAVKESRLAQEQQALVMRGQQNNLDGLAAGFESAALAYSKQNTAFATGSQIFQSSAQLMSSAFTKWRQTGQFDMNEFLASWADMIAQMGMKWAASQVFNSIAGAAGGAGGAGGLFGWLGGLFGGGGASGVGSTVPDFIAAGGNAFADGGRPPLGETSLVGEEGPELFVPDTSGTIIPAAKTADMLSGGGGDVVVHQTFNISTGVQATVRAELASMMPSIQQATVDAVRQARERGGRFAASFR